MTLSTGRGNRETPADGERIMIRQHFHWRRLLGTTVQLRQHGRIIRTGTVDDATVDSTVLWIEGETNRPRTMYEAASGIEVWVEQEKAEDKRFYRKPSTARSRN